MKHFCYLLFTVFLAGCSNGQVGNTDTSKGIETAGDRRMKNTEREEFDVKLEMFFEEARDVEKRLKSSVTVEDSRRIVNDLADARSRIPETPTELSGVTVDGKILQHCILLVFGEVKRIQYLHELAIIEKQTAGLGAPGSLTEQMEKALSIATAIPVRIKAIQKAIDDADD